jgi:hypothetical protein
MSLKSKSKDLLHCKALSHVMIALQNIQEYKETIPIYTKMEQWRYHYTQELLNSTNTTLGTQDTAQTKQSEKQPNTEHYKDEQHGPTKNEVNPLLAESKQFLYASYKTPVLIHSISILQYLNKMWVFSFYVDLFPLSPTSLLLNLTILVTRRVSYKKHTGTVYSPQAVGSPHFWWVHVVHLYAEHKC